MPIVTNFPWSQAKDFWNYNITCVDIRTRVIPENTNYWFAELYGLIEIRNVQNIDTSNVKDMSYMFNECTSLSGLNLSNFNTSNVIDMTCMFALCNSLTNLDLSSFNINNETEMWEIFNKYYLNIVYVKDEETKAKVEDRVSSSCQVIVKGSSTTI